MSTLKIQSTQTLFTSYIHPKNKGFVISPAAAVYETVDLRAGFGLTTRIRLSRLSSRIRPYNPDSGEAIKLHAATIFWSFEPDSALQPGFGRSDHSPHYIQTVDTYTGMNKLNRFIKVQKDKLTTDQHSNVVYKISCADCDASYVGQTRRLLLTRIKEHRSHISRNTLQKSVITNHRLTGHEFKWEEVEVLDREPILNKRLTSEMIFIKRQKNSLNMQSDTDNLNAAYIPLLENFSTI
ncbi:MAG: GIY-YIG nuclease family protein [Gammaproteobacteria bacterium]|nr:MAG: GIY-YIG nuclease family protein [Gammaproteobacteria bacterium]